MADVLLRQWQMLRLLPRAPRKTDAGSLERKLVDAGFEIDRRSIQRDLIALSASFPIECDNRSKPYGWSWSRDGVPFDLPAMDVQAALAFRVAAQHLEHLLPSSTRAHLEPYFKQARAQLSRAPGGLADWPGSVIAIHAGPPLLTPRVDSKVLEAVHVGLLEERRLEVLYRRRGAREARKYLLSPLALVYREGIAILVASASEYDDALQFPLHRMSRADVMDTPRRVPPGFALRDLVDGGEFDFRLSPGPMLLELLVEETVEFKLSETPLSLDQRLDPVAGGPTRLTATVADTNQLRAWLRSFGAFVEVVGPATLREQMAREARATAQRYADAPEGGHTTADVPDA
ncbi:MAG: WYL domain-containing protein [Myxococcales bacterium]|nr:WYL domain-containing protein [Myxococcales bacterium]